MDAFRYPKYPHAQTEAEYWKGRAFVHAMHLELDNPTGMKRWIIHHEARRTILEQTTGPHLDVGYYHDCHLGPIPEPERKLLEQMYPDSPAFRP